MASPKHFFFNFEFCDDTFSAKSSSLDSAFKFMKNLTILLQVLYWLTFSGLPQQYHGDTTMCFLPTQSQELIPCTDF
jgi:hypothetical protein